MFEVPPISCRERLDAARAAVEAAERVWLAEVAAVDRDLLWKADGATSLAGWLRRRYRLKGHTASETVRMARFLGRSPSVAAAWDEGRISGDHVRLMAREAVLAPDEFDRVEADMADIASRVEPQSLVEVLRKWRDLVDPDGTDPADRYGQRFLRWVKGTDGSVMGEFRLSEVEGAELVRLMERLVADERAADEQVAPVARRSDAQLRADALTEAVRAARTHLASGQPVDQTGLAGTIVFDAERLQGGDGRCDLDGVAVSAALAREACCEGSLRRVVTSASVPIDVGRARRFATPAQRAALEVRDRGCVFSGCGRAARHCIAHHLVPWDQGGVTDLDNLALLCRHHHRLVHRRWSIERTPAGPWITRSPFGIEVGDEPLWRVA